MTTELPTFNLKNTAKGFNVYSGPGTSYDRVKVGNKAVYILPLAKGDNDPWYFVSTEVPENTQYPENTILGKDVDKAVWYRIRVKDEDENIDITGWIRAVHVQTQDDLSGVPIAWTPVQLSFDSHAIVRSGPDVRYDAVGSITAGSKYNVLGKDSDLDQDEDPWYEILYDSDRTGWVQAAQAWVHDAQASITQDELPVTWLPPLRAGSLQLPFAEGTVPDITSLFDDPRRGPGGWDPDQRSYHRHEGIDWGCGTGTPVRAMAHGSMTDVGENSQFGKYVVIRTRKIGKYIQLRTKDQDRGLSFTLTYMHLNSVTVEEGTVEQGQEVGISGNTGNSSGPHLHVHYVPRDAEGQSSTVNWPDFLYYGNYHDFHAALPPGTYHWPDIAALQAEIDTAPVAVRDNLGKLINQRMENLLLGTTAARLRVKSGAKVYAIPQVDDDYAYPCQPLANYAIAGRDNWVRDLPQPFADSLSTPDWWKIKMPQVEGEPYFPVWWVRRQDAEEIGDLSKVRLALPTATELPRYLKKDANDTYAVRGGPNTLKDENGTLVNANNELGPLNDKGKATPPPIKKWVPIVDLACDLATKDHLWYQIPYDTNDASKLGWVRADVVDHLLGTDPETDELAFPNDTDTLKPKIPAYTTPRAESASNQVVPVHPHPNGKSSDTLRFAGTAPIKGISSLWSPWYQLQFADGHRGWVRADQVTARNTGGLKAVQPRLRRRPGGAAAIPVRNGPAADGTVLAALGTADTGWHALRGRDTAHPGWWQIRYVGPVAGWVSRTQVQTHGSLNGLGVTWTPVPQLSLRATTTLGLRVRSGPGTGHDKVGFIAGGSIARYDILGKDAATATWWQIRYSPTVVGWVHGGYVQTHGSLTGLAVTAVPQLSLKATTTDGLRVRSRPGTAHSQVGSIAGGSTDRYDILGKDAATAAWYQIRFSGSIVGWVHGNHVRTHGDLSGLAVTAVPQLSLRATTTLGLNVRSGPAATNAKVGFISGGSTAKYDILGKDTATATWYRIRFSSSVTGWVHGNYIQTHGDLTGLEVTWVPQLSLKTSAANGLAVHAGPGATHAQTGFIASGSTAKYDILGKNAATATWYQIRRRATVDGWVRADAAVETDGNLDLAPPPRVGLAAAQSCAVRATPAANGTVRATITDGAKRYPALEKDTATAAWYKIRFSGSINGWVQASCVRLHGDGRNLPVAGTRPAPVGPQLNLKSSVTAGLNLRTGPGTTHRILLTLPAGATRYGILGKDSDTAGWYEIRYGGTVTGWVSAPHVQTHGSLAGLTVTWNPAPQLGLPTGAAYGLNVRSGPGIDHNRVGLITAGSTVRYDILGKDADAAGWYQIRFGDAVGWVHAGHVRTHGDLGGLRVTWVPQLSLNAAAGTGMAVHAGPGPGHTQVGFIVAGSTVRYEILGKDADATGWYQIRLGSTVTGWVPADRVQTHGNLDGLEVTWLPQLGLGAAPYGLYVRSGPGDAHDQMGVIVAGSTDRHDILGKDADMAGWYQIRFGPTVVGWVPAARVQTYGSLAGLKVTWVPQLSLKAGANANLDVHSGPGHHPRPGRPHHRRLHRPLRHPGQGRGHGRLVRNPPRRHGRRLGVRGPRPDPRPPCGPGGDLESHPATAPQGRDLARTQRALRTRHGPPPHWLHQGRLHGGVPHPGPG